MLYGGPGTEISCRTVRAGTGWLCGANWPERTNELEEKTLEFCALAKRLLFEEKIATLTGTVSKLGKVNERVDALRISLFGNKMNHGGLCGALFDLIDRMLLDLIRSVGEIIAENLTEANRTAICSS